MYVYIYIFMIYGKTGKESGDFPASHVWFAKGTCFNLKPIYLIFFHSGPQKDAETYFQDVIDDAEIKSPDFHGIFGIYG
jgi:hypothetical protein